MYRGFKALKKWTVIMSKYFKETDHGVYEYKDTAPVLRGSNEDHERLEPSTFWQQVWSVTRTTGSRLHYGKYGLHHEVLVWCKLVLARTFVPGRYTCTEGVESFERARNSVTSFRSFRMCLRLIHEVCCLITEKDNDRIRSPKYPQLL